MKKYNTLLSLLVLSFVLKWIATSGIRLTSEETPFLLTSFWILKSFAYFPVGLWGYKDAKNSKIYPSLVLIYLTFFSNLGLLTYLLIRFLISSSNTDKDPQLKYETSKDKNV